MRVIGVTEFGGPEALRLFEVPESHAGPGEVRIAVRAAAVNPTDTYIRNGARAEMLERFPPPYVPGMDVAGIVDEVGDGVTTVKVGDSVRLRRTDRVGTPLEDLVCTVIAIGPDGVPLGELPESTGNLLIS